jgi:hypothetical protein
VKLSSYGIERPSQLGVTTADDVKLHLEFTVKPAAPAVAVLKGGEKMMRGTGSARLVLVAAVLGASSASSFALPTMVRLGYANCAACHISPQGGGPLNAYGRAIDEAQSLRSDEYRPSNNRLLRVLSANGRILQDLRMVLSEQGSWTGDREGVHQFRPRLMYRNVTELGKGFRLAATVTGETEAAPRPSLAYDPPVRAAQALLSTALIHYRPSKSLEFAVGKDQLPTGVNNPDLGALLKSRNRFGYYDSPLQAKAFIAHKRHQLMPFVFAPGGNEAAGERESGAGTLAGIDLLGTGKTVVGVSFLKGTAASGGRRLVGAYTRLGFGRWGLLFEHDVTDRTRDAPAGVSSFRQQASYAQVFVALREWLVLSGIGERLAVEAPFAERLNAGRVELAARLSNQASIGFSVRAQRNQLTGIWSRSLALQLALKSPQ